MKMYKVKLKSIEIHNLDISAFDIEDAIQQAEYVIVSENNREIEPDKIDVKIQGVQECQNQS